VYCCLSVKVGLVLGSVHVWAQYPLFLSCWLVHSAQANLVRLHFEAGAQLFRLHCFVVGFAVHMVAEGDEVVSVLVRDDALCVNFRHWPDVL